MPEGFLFVFRKTALKLKDGFLLRLERLNHWLFAAMAVLLGTH